MKHSKKKTQAHSSLRIIGGHWRGRKLPILASDGLRPTGDRLRETLFNWLTPDLPGARCLDLFAGTGALGLEALSRGAASVTLLELQRKVADQLRDSCATLGIRDADIIEANALAWLTQKRAQPVDPFDIAFVDPPFTTDLWQKSVDALEGQKFLADGARIYVEMPRQLHLSPPSNWVLHRRKPAGAICAYLFIKNDGQETNHPEAR